ncbi:MAG: hypothetical protein R8G33_00150 [Gammaproteobacteria bacterium]|nr:hypothetical protein [Gammaproteobacteria bacterium]
MSGSFQYGFRSRFYGLFSQLPWSLFVTAIVLVPVVYLAEPATRELIIHIAIYWTLVMSVVMLFKDLYTQRYLFEFSIKRCGISVQKNPNTMVEYTWQQVRAIRSFHKKDKFSRRTLDGNGVLLKFDDGFELPVFEQVSNYDEFNSILKRIST